MREELRSALRPLEDNGRRAAGQAKVVTAAIFLCESVPFIRGEIKGENIPTSIRIPATQWHQGSSRSRHYNSHKP
jgi:hypothetical protein